MGFARPISVPGFSSSDVGSPADPSSGAPSAALVPFVQATTLPGAQDVLDDAMPFTDVASATTTAIGAVASNKVRITGTTTITGLGTIGTGIRRLVRFAAALTLTHNATSLILPASANITTAADDTAEFVSLGSGNWLCLWYKKASGLFLATSKAMLEALGTWRVLAAGTVAALTGSTSETELARVVVEAGAMGANGRIRVTHMWGYTNGADDKFPRLKFGATGVAIGSATLVKGGTALTTTAVFRDQSVIANLNAANSQAFFQPGSNGGGFGTNASAHGTSAIDTTAATDVIFTGQLENGADSLTLLDYMVEVYYRA
jgi:hypothetical protein